MSKLRKQFPYEQGWIHMTLTLTSATPLSEDELKKVASLGKPDHYEFGHLQQHGKTLKVVSRQKKGRAGES